MFEIWKRQRQWRQIDSIGRKTMRVNLLDLINRQEESPLKDVNFGQSERRQKKREKSGTTIIKKEKKNANKP